MVRLVAVISFLCTTGFAQAQKDSTRTSPSPWFELTAGLHSPAGILGIGVGVPVGRIFTPAIAAGFGGSEGKHLSAGAEVHIGKADGLDVRAYGYWTYTTGRIKEENSKYGSETSSGQLLKLGAAWVMRFGATQLVLRTGWAWYLEVPREIGTYSGGSIDGSGYDPFFRGGASIGFSARFPLASQH